MASTRGNNLLCRGILSCHIKITVSNEVQNSVHNIFTVMKTSKYNLCKTQVVSACYKHLLMLFHG